MERGPHFDCNADVLFGNPLEQLPQAGQKLMGDLHRFMLLQNKNVGLAVECSDSADDPL